MKNLIFILSCLISTFCFSQDTSNVKTAKTSEKLIDNLDFMFYVDTYIGFSILVIKAKAIYANEVKPIVRKCGSTSRREKQAREDQGDKWLNSGLTKVNH